MRLVEAMMRTCSRQGVDPVLWPRLAGSWPGVIFTGEPLQPPAGITVRFVVGLI